MSQSQLLAILSEGASAWLNNVIPSLSSLVLKLSYAELPFVLCPLCLGFILCQPHERKCGQDVKSDDQHGLNCDEQIGCFPRHTEANVLNKTALNQIDCHVLVF